jgi:hypothetical protein
VGVLGFLWQRSTFYRPWRAAALILARRVTPSRHRAASPDREVEDDLVSGLIERRGMQAGLATGPSCRAAIW